MKCSRHRGICDINKCRTAGGVGSHGCRARCSEHLPARPPRHGADGVRGLAAGVPRPAGTRSRSLTHRHRCMCPYLWNESHDRMMAALSAFPAKIAFLLLSRQRCPRHRTIPMQTSVLLLVRPSVHQWHHVRQGLAPPDDYIYTGSSVSEAVVGSGQGLTDGLSRITARLAPTNSRRACR